MSKTIEEILPTLETESSPCGGLMFIKTRQGDEFITHQGETHQVNNTAYVLVAGAGPNVVLGYVGNLGAGELGFFQHEEFDWDEVELPAEDMFLAKDLVLNQHALRFIADFVERKNNEIIARVAAKTAVEALGL